VSSNLQLLGQSLSHLDQLLSISEKHAQFYLHLLINVKDKATSAEAEMSWTQSKDASAALQGHKYISLTTFRKNGEPVPTPV